ncbi:MAG: hypothetical protein ACREX0_09810 [Noviherbaspirillum sp.]
MITASSKMNSKRIRRVLVCIGVFSIFLSCFSFLLSLGMPGVGWVMAALALILASLLTPFIGRRYVSVALIVSSVHLFTIGPLSFLHQPVGAQGSMPPLSTIIVVVVVPFAIALFSLFLPKWHSRERDTDRLPDQ